MRKNAVGQTRFRASHTDRPHSKTIKLDGIYTETRRFFHCTFDRADRESKGARTTSNSPRCWLRGATRRRKKSQRVLTVLVYTRQNGKFYSVLRNGMLHRATSLPPRPLPFSALLSLLSYIYVLPFHSSLSSSYPGPELSLGVKLLAFSTLPACTEFSRLPGISYPYRFDFLSSFLLSLPLFIFPLANFTFLAPLVRFLDPNTIKNPSFNSNGLINLSNESRE